MPGSERLLGLARFVVIHRTLTIALGLTVTACLANGIRHLHVDVDPDQQLPQQHQFIQTYHEVTRLFGDTSALTIALSPTAGDVFEPQFLIKLQQITRDIGNIPGCVRPLLKGLAAPDSKQVLLDGAILRVVPIAVTTPDSADELGALRRRVLADPLLRGTLMSSDGRSTAIYATFELTPATPGYLEIYRRITSIIETHQDGTFAYHIAGPIAVVAALTTYSERALSLFPIALLIIAFVHYEAFRTWSSVLLPILTGLLAVVWAMGIMGYCGVSIDPLNATTPVLILAVGAGHAVQILKRYYEHYFEHGDSQEAVIASMAATAPATIASCTIAALSFASLATLQTDSMRTFGVFTALGIASVLAIELSLMPALRAISRPAIPDTRVNRRSPLGERFLRQLGYALADKRTAYRVVLGYGLLILTCLYLSQRLTTDSSLIRQFPRDASIWKADHFISSKFSGSSILLILIEGPDDGAIATPTAMNALDIFERQLERLPSVGRALSITDTLKTLHRAMATDQDDPNGAFPDNSQLIAQYLLLYSMSGGTDLFTMITPDYRIAKVVVLVRDDSTRLGQSTIGQVRALATEILPKSFQVRVAGTVASDLALTEVMVRGKLINICQVAIITVVVAAAILRSVTAGLLVSAPLALAILVNFAIMQLLGIALDITTAAVSAMAVGLGADYAIYLIFRLREELKPSFDFGDALSLTLATSGQAILFVAAAIGLGYSVLCVSGFAIYTNLGLLIGTAMMTSSLASVIVLPAFLTLLRGRRLGDIFT